MNSGNQFLTKMSEFIEANKLIKRGDTILVGFSGGPDSTVLLHALLTLRITYHLTLLAAHVNYHLRGAESVADMNFARDFCFQHNISLVIKEVKIKALTDLENEARKIRFDFFNSLINTYKIDKIALGHNKNDVSETMLLHLFRGSGVTGMKGIIPKVNNIIRPLLCFQRNEIIDYLQKMKLNEWCEDSSNKENLYTRNKLRNDFIPWLEANINQKVVETLYENSLIFKETDEYLREIASRMLKKALINQNSKEVRIDLRDVDSKNQILLFYLFRGAIIILTGSETGFYHNHFKEICSLLPANGSKMIKLPGEVNVRKEYHELTFLLNTGKEQEAEGDDKQALQLDLAKKYHIFGNKRILIKRISRNEIKRSFYEDDNIALLDLDKISLPITVGYRQDGDRFVPMGMKGTKKLKDFFIDEKISKFERDRVLIFRDMEKIVWIAGLRIDDRVRIEELTQSVLILKIENIRIRSRKIVARKKI